jgi:murein DD-endopeptidase MepM/ murein hydrolase activator NlpD
MKLRIPEKFQRLKKILIWVFTFIVLLQVAYYIFDQYETRRIMKELAKQKEVEKPAPVLLFNLPVDSFTVVPGQVRSGQNLSDILNKQGISMAKVDEIAKKSVLTFDVRKMKVNNNFYFFMNKKQPSKVEYFIYEINAVDYVVYTLGDSLRIYKEKKPIITMVKTASGVINSSLWRTFEQQALNTDLAIVLANEIYAWTIDFYGIKKGDKFRLVYEENFVFGKSIGIGRIFAAQFVHANEDFYAFRFTQNNEDSYFDEKGKSQKKAFLKAPLKFNRISSQFSNARFHPVLKIYRPHHGVDYAAPTGTPVYTIGEGTIIAKGYQASGGGNFVKVKHNSVYTTSYMHLSKFESGIAPGVRVKQGQVIGYVGSTGLSSGPHLDFRVFMNGSPVNPLSIKSPPTEPVFEKNMKEFTALRDSMIVKLNEIKNF